MDWYWVPDQCISMLDYWCPKSQGSFFCAGSSLMNHETTQQPAPTARHEQHIPASAAIPGISSTEMSPSSTRLHWLSFYTQGHWCGWYSRSRRDCSHPKDCDVSQIALQLQEWKSVAPLWSNHLESSDQAKVSFLDQSPPRTLWALHTSNEVCWCQVQQKYWPSIRWQEACILLSVAYLPQVPREVIPFQASDHCRFPCPRDDSNKQMQPSRADPGRSLPPARVYY